MAKQSLYSAIDIGSNKVVCVTGITDESDNRIKILGQSIIYCPDGIKAGVITDIQEATIAIRKACYESEKLAGGIIKDTVVALRGSYIEPRSSKGMANTDERERKVTEDTIAEVLDNAKKMVKLSAEQEILQIVPREFIISSQRGIKNPVGKEGAFIEVDAISFISPSSNLNDVRYAFEQANIPLGREMYGYISVSEVVVNKDEKESGCLVIDFGHLTTGFVLYVDGILKYANEIQVGSYHITKDIGHRLRTSLSVAEEIKEKYGSVIESRGSPETELKYPSNENNGKIKDFDKRELSKVIASRVDQVLFHINEILTSNRFDETFLSGGIIITGGGSLLNGMVKACKQYFGCSVRMGYPLETKVMGEEEIISNPAYTTAIGALSFFLSESYDAVPKRSGFGWMDKVLQLVDRYFVVCL